MSILQKRRQFRQATQAEQEAGASNIVAVTPATQQLHPSAAKGWVKFNMAAAILASYNVSSITDNGSGDWTVNWNVDFSSADYAVVVSALCTSASSKLPIVVAQTAGSVQIQNVTAAGVLGETNTTAIYCVAYGDQ